MLGLHRGEQAVQPDWEHTKRPRSSNWIDASHIYRQTDQLRLHEEVKSLFDQDNTNEHVAVVAQLVARITRSLHS
jgi:hypothetical protein